MKKVLLSSYACSPIRGSEENIGWSWTYELALRGYEIWCLTNVEDKDDVLEYKAKLNLDNLNFVFVSLPWKLDKHLLKNSSKTIYLHYKLWTRKAANIGIALHEEHKFDIAHHVSYGSLQQGSSLYKLKNCKIIFGPVGGGQMALPLFKEYFGPHWKTEMVRERVSNFLMNYNKSLKETLKNSELVLAANYETKNLLSSLSYYDSDKTIMVNDISTSVQHENLKFIDRVDNKTLKILWIGRLIPRKGIGLSLKALSFLPKDFAYELTIVGDGEQGRDIKRWIQEYDLDAHKINHKGWIPFTEVTEEYRRADLMMFCSLRDTFGSQVIEAMAHSLPVLAFDISGIRLLPDDCCVKISTSTKNDIAKEIAENIMKMKDAKLRKAIGLNAYNYAMENTWKNKVNTFADKYY